MCVYHKCVINWCKAFSHNHLSKTNTKLEQNLSKPKPATSTKTKPAASIEQSSNRAIESNLQIEPSEPQRFPMGPLYGRHRAPHFSK